MALNKIKRTTLVEQVVEIIITNIKNSDYKIGEILPSETDMSEQFGVSRATIRESTSYLIGMGILKKSDNGLEVVESPSSAILKNLSSFIDIGLETQSLYEARIMFEVGFAYLASLKASKEDLQNLEDINNTIVDNLDNKDLYWKSDSEFHHHIAQISNNEFLLSIYKMIMKMFTEQVSNKENNIFEQKQVVQNTPSSHKNLIEALKSGDSMNAMDITIKSMDKAMEDMIGRRIKQAIPDNKGTKK